MAVYRFARRRRPLYLRRIRGPAQPSPAPDIYEQAARTAELPVTPYPGLGPGLPADVPQPVKKYFESFRPGIPHLWVDRRLFSAYLGARPVAQGFTLATVTPPERWRFCLFHYGVGWESKCFRAYNRIQVRVNNAPWRDLMGVIANESATEGNFDPGRTDVSGTGVGTVLRGIEVGGINEDDLIGVYLDIGPSDTLTIEAVQPVSNDAGMVQVRVRGIFYNPIGRNQ